MHSQAATWYHFYYKWEMYYSQIALVFLTRFLLLELHHPCRSDWVHSLYKNNFLIFQNMHCLECTFPLRYFLLPKRLGYVFRNSIHLKCPSFSTSPVCSHAQILLIFFLHWEPFKTSTDRNLFCSASTFPDESSLFLFPKEVVTGTKHSIYFNEGSRRYQHCCLLGRIFHSALHQDENAKLHPSY